MGWLLIYKISILTKMESGPYFKHFVMNGFYFCLFPLLSRVLKNKNHDPSDQCAQGER